MSLKITRTEHGDVTVLHLDGRITLGEGSSLLRNTVRELVNAGRIKLVIAYAEVRYQDSSGNGTLVSACTVVRNAGGELVLAGLREGVRELFLVTKLYTCFDVYDSVQEAVAHFSKGKREKN